MSRLSLSMIVKNEMADLERCVDSVAKLVDEVAIADTGSTDGTWALVQTIAHRHVQMVWAHHFADARNIALDLVTADWILVLDGDEILADGHQAVRDAITDPNLIAAELKIRNDLGDGKVGEFWAVRLFRCHPDIRWEGRIHEQVLPGIQRVMSRDGKWQVRRIDARIDHGGYVPEVFQAKKKAARNVDLLKRSLDELEDDAPLTKRVYLEYKLSSELGLGPAGQPYLARAANRLLAASPEERRVFGLTAQVLVTASQQWSRGGALEQALLAADAVGVLHPTNSMVALVRAQALLPLNRTDEAGLAAVLSRDTIGAESAFHYDPVAHDVALSVVEATIALRRGDAEKQKSILESLCERYPAHTGADLARLRVLVERGEAAVALRGGLEHIKRFGATRNALLLCADAAQLLGLTDKAQKWRNMAAGG
jgi:hypothetical protein